MKEADLWGSPSDTVTRQLFLDAVANNPRLTPLACEVARELARMMRPDGTADTSITRIARKLDAEADDIGRAVAQLRARGFVGGDRKADGILCKLPTGGLDVIGAWFGRAA